MVALATIMLRRQPRAMLGVQAAIGSTIVIFSHGTATRGMIEEKTGPRGHRALLHG